MARMWHVTSVRNRESIEVHGLDVSWMGAACGIAGAQRAEADGVFLSDNEFDADFFVRMNNTGGPVDLWAVDGVDGDDLVDNGSGFAYLPGTVTRSQLELVRADVEPVPFEPDCDGSDGAYSSSLTITLDNVE